MSYKYAKELSLFFFFSHAILSKFNENLMKFNIKFQFSPNANRFYWTQLNSLTYPLPYKWMQCNVFTVLIYFATKIQANLSNNMENHIWIPIGLVMKKSWFYWKTYWVCDTYKPFSIPTDPDNFPVFQPILMKTYRDLRQYSGKWNIKFHLLLAGREFSYVQ